MKKYLYLLSFAFLTLSCEKKEQKNISKTDNNWVLKSTKEYTPLSFIEAAKKTVNPFDFSSIENDFQKGWITAKDLDSLILVVDSKETCNCYLDPLSSYIPNDSAQVGGFAIEFIKAFKENKKVDFGLYSCPKVDEKEAEELKVWWKNQNRE
ncbi:hypothetical protein [Flavobacterium sp. 102]|uniref:hypothetical protein n=1 Tax=Flavobacterium sp. 102 TaxID=2135623 RepID=UPI000EB4FD96|nr:hypothetical protein [Flavobacterium sp. 102]RKS02840.1 hypothetical protein C8C84_2570 [Flavobacterium sp. 102]RKS02854.1 hypothetical protein C8C84_2584 [Flavobacterium sp. 102]